MKNVIRFIILGLSFLGLFVISTFISLIINKIEKIISRGNHNLKIIKVLKCVKNIMVICGVLISILIAVPFNYDGKLQQKYDSIVNQISDYLYTFFNKDDLYEQETEISIENNIIEPLKEFPFRIEYNVIFPETKEIRIPTPEEPGIYSMEIPLDLRAEEYQSEKVPINSDIHGFVVNNLYYCSDDHSVTDISEYNYYRFADYWFYLHTIDISFTDYDGFDPDLNGATIVLQEKETQKKIVLQENYLKGQFVQFQCSTGQYIIEVQKGGIAYTHNLNLNKNEKMFLALSADDYYYLSSDEKDSYIAYEDNDEEQSNEESTSHNEDLYIDVTMEDNLEEIDNDSEDEKIKDTDIDTSTTSLTVPDLTGMDEATAISTCMQNGYKYSIEYYLGGNETVIFQSPTSSESMEVDGSITINIGISQNDFSNRLLALINEKRRSAGLGELSFSEQLNTVCNILAQENVNSVNCIRPNGSHWSSVLGENGILLSDGIFTTRNNITSLSDANGRIKYAGNSYGEGNLLTSSYTIIGMAYSSNNMLVIIVGC